MSAKPTNKSQRSPAEALALVTSRGARTRKHRYLRDLRQFAIPVLASIVFQTAIYILVATRPGRDDWHNIALTVVFLAAAPALGAIVLTAFRLHAAPLISAFVVSATLFSMSVSMLSALRIPLSYLAVLLSVPVAIAIIAYANVRHNRSSRAKVAVVTFDGQGELLRQIKRDIPIITSPDADLSDIDILLVDPQAHHNARWSPLLAQCYLADVEILSWPRYVEIWHGRIDVNSFDIAHIAYSPSQLIYARTKRLLDLGITIASLPLTIPIMALVAAYIFARDPGQVLFVQLRRGFGGRHFRMYKFRTMYKGTGGGATTSGDSRIIPGCGILRKLRLDELPQLYNILIGEMSLIGPRPEALDLAKWYEREIPQYTNRVLVLPGITGWAQVKHGYTSNPKEARDKLSYDLYYIKNLSLDLDLLIVFHTLTTVLLGKGR